MRFDVVADALAGVPYMPRRQGRILYDHILETRPERILELGTAHGVSAAYMAAALDELGTGRVTTVDHAVAAFDPAPEQILDRVGLHGRVEVVREHSSYTWFLKERIEERSDAHGNCEPLYDLCFIDGAKNWTIDGLAVFLVEKLLRPGGWLLLDDLDWTYDRDARSQVSDGIVRRALSDAERREPHVRAILELIVKQHPSFTTIKVQDEMWGWARKAPGEPRRLELESTQPLGAMIGRGLRRAVRRAGAGRAG